MLIRCKRLIMVSRVLILVLLGGLFCPGSIMAVPDPGITILVNGQPVALDVPAEVVNDRILVPIRAVAEALGCTVNWFEEQQMVAVFSNSSSAILYMGTTEAYTNGEPANLDTAPVNIDGRILVPLRFVAESLGASVQWDSGLRQVIISKITVDPAPPAVAGSRFFDQPGTYGPESGSETIEGDVVINASGVTLQNIVITGRLIIIEGGGTGGICLKHVTVSGGTEVFSGGRNPIILNDSSFSGFTVHSSTVPVSLELTGTNIQSMTLDAPVLLSGTGAITNLTVNAGGCEIQFAPLNKPLIGYGLSALIGGVRVYGPSAVTFISEGSSTVPGPGPGPGSLDLSGVSADVPGGRLTGTSTLMQYSLNSTNGSDGAWTDCAAPQTAIVFPAGPVYVREKGNPGNFRLVYNPGPPVPALAISAAGGLDQILASGTLALSANRSDVYWIVNHFEGAGGSLSASSGQTVNLLGPGAPGGSGTGSSGYCVITATASNGESQSLTVYIQGDGSQAYPYIIRNATQLDAIRDADSDGLGASGTNYTTSNYYKLVADIDLSGWNGGADWVPINTNAPAGGTAPHFDGRNHTISNLKIGRPGAPSAAGNAGLFGTTDSDYRIANLRLSGTVIYTSGSYAGGIAGHNSGTISNCTNSGRINAYNSAGGIAGYNVGTISNCANSGSVTSVGTTACASGIASYNSGTISNCASSGSINACAVKTITAYAGGLAGVNFGTISNCASSGNINAYATSAASSGAAAGGIAGLNNGTIGNCASRGRAYIVVPTDATTHGAGGIAGRNNNTIRDCVAICDSASGSSLMGLAPNVGRICATGTNINCYALSTMLVNIATTGPGGINGIDMSAVQASTESFYTTAGNWNAGAWNFTTVWMIPPGGGYPVLRGLP